MPNLPVRTLLACAAAAALWLPAATTAHDWPSPRVQSPSAEPAWPGQLWAGPASGMPPAPTATDCRRPPQPFEVGDGLPRQPPQAAPADGVPEPRRRAEAMAAHSGKASMERLSKPAPAIAMAPPLPSAPPPAGAADSAHRAQTPTEPVTAGMVDDNADFGAYRSFQQRWGRQLPRALALHERVRLDVRDGLGRPLPDAQVEVWSGGRLQPLAARTDAAGRAWLMPQSDVAGSQFELRVSHGGARQAVRWPRGQPDALQVRLDGARSGPARLDLVFAIDATGSMADEIAKLRASMRAVAAQIAALPSAPALCYGLVAYRDRGDAFFVRGTDFTNDLDAFQRQLDQLEADGGGDYREAMAEALHTAVHRLSWRGEGTARLVVLLADAPPQPRVAGPHADQEARAALARGIKIHAVGASGLDREGELQMRQLAQATGGRFVFLTYANRHDPSSGPGRETVHAVRDYSVETLDKLLVRLVADEMAAWPSAGR